MALFENRNAYENLTMWIFDGVGEYGIPEIKANSVKPEKFIGCNYAKTCKKPEENCLHFFVDDYQFSRFWVKPDNYIGLLKKFYCVCSPDFSTYTDFPRAIQIYNHYRKHWLAAYWQMHGIKVIPTISWSDKDSFDWCFDGEPKKSIVAVSSVGTQKSQRRLEIRNKRQDIQEQGKGRKSMRG